MRGSSEAGRVRRGRSAPGLAVVLAAVLALLTTLLAVNTAEATSPPRASNAVGPVAAAAAEDERAEWTMMVYAVADTENIGSLMTTDLAELAALPDDPDVNIVVLVDMPGPGEPGGGDGTLPGTGPFTTAKLLKLEGGKYEEVRDLGELAMGRPDTLANFIEEAADRFPADHYGLTLMDHGGAYTGGYLDVAPSTQMMSVSDIRAGMIMGLQQAGIDRFDVLFHSSCLMSNYEAASALGPLATVMAGSEEVMYVFAMLPPGGFAAAQAGGDGDAIAQSFMDGYVRRIEEEALVNAEFGEELASIRDLIAVSVINGDQMSTLDQALKSFSDVAVAHMDEIVTQVARARAETLQFMINAPNAGDATGYDLFDLGDFLIHLRDVPDAVAVARDAAYTALTNAVTHQVTGRGTSQATGLSVYLPISAEFVGGYLEQRAGPPGWSAFVDSFVKAAASSGPDTPQGGGARFVSQEAQVLQADGSGIKIAGQLVSGGSASVVDQETQVYTRIGDQPDALALALPAYLDAGGEGQVQGIWDYSLTVLTDGQKSLPATTIYQAQEGGLIGTFLAQYVSPEGDSSDIGVRVLLSSQGAIESVSTFSLNDEDGNSTAGVTLEVGGTLGPYLYIPSSSGFKLQLSSESIAVSEQLAVAFTRLPVGTDFDMGVVVSDASGGFDSAFTSQKVR